MLGATPTFTALQQYSFSLNSGGSIYRYHKSWEIFRQEGGVVRRDQNVAEFKTSLFIKHIKKNSA